jgi:hypothetical protein
MSQYYYLVASLPEPDSRLPVEEISETLEHIHNNLKAADAYAWRYLLYPQDHANLVRILLNDERPFLPFGFYNPNRLTRYRENPEDFPAYLQRFLEQYTDDQLEPNRKSLLTRLHKLYLQEMKPHALLNLFIQQNKVMQTLTGLHFGEQPDDENREWFVASRTDWLDRQDYPYTDNWLELLPEGDPEKLMQQRARIYEAALQDEVRFSFFNLNRVLVYTIRILHTGLESWTRQQQDRYTLDVMIEQILNQPTS